MTNTLLTVAFIGFILSTILNIMIDIRLAQIMEEKNIFFDFLTELEFRETNLDIIEEIWEKITYMDTKKVLLTFWRPVKSFFPYDLLIKAILKANQNV